MKLVEQNQNKLLIDEDIRFYSSYDIKYCIELLNKKKEEDKIKKNKLRAFLNEKIYKWDENFRFSSRLVNAHVVAFISLYYFFVEWVYYGIMFINTLIGTQSDALGNLLIYEF